MTVCHSLKKMNTNNNKVRDRSKSKSNEEEQQEVAEGKEEIIYYLGNLIDRIIFEAVSNQSTYINSWLWYYL
jgi:hypothetical protein